MKTNKIVGLLLAVVMLFSLACPVLAATKLTVDTDKNVYEFGDTITITTNAKKVIEVYNPANARVLYEGKLNYVDSNKYEITITPAEDDNWTVGKYTVKAGAGADVAQTTFEIKKAVVGDYDCNISFSASSAKVKAETVVFSISAPNKSNFKNLDDVTVKVKVTDKNGDKLVPGRNEDYRLKFRDSFYDDGTIDTTGKLAIASYRMVFYNVGKNNKIEVTVESESQGVLATATKKAFEVKKTTTTDGSGGTTGGTGNLWIPNTTDGGIAVKLNNNQFTDYGIPSNAVTTGSTLSTNSFVIGVTVNGVARTAFSGYDPVLAKVPYIPETANTDNLVVIDGNGNIVARSLYNNGAMLVTMKNINGTFTINEITKSFDDVWHDWAVKPIGALAARNILNGVGDNLFDPDRAVTRAEFIKMIVTMFDVYDSNAAYTFADLSADQWFASYVGTAQALGITNGYEDNTFRPYDIISREEMSAMLYRAATTLGVNMPSKNDKSVYADDANIQAYASDSVYSMQSAGILKGIGDGMFDPQGVCTRAQGAVAVFNMFAVSMEMYK